MDISEFQIAHAEHRENISYPVSRAEHTNFDPETFNLITVVQAIHWFDFELFYYEVACVSESGGFLAVWGYGLLQFHNATINHYNQTLL
jgi:ubiquinone/menaquinone biosynthesis C-methylase UbiE